jgi:hypothetical protein
MEGQNIAFEHRSAHDEPELFPKLALELASLNVDVIFARGTWPITLGPGTIHGRYRSALLLLHD